MFNFTFDEDKMEALFIQELNKRLDKLEHQSLLMDSGQLCQYLNLCWSTIEKEFLSDPEFPCLRYGRKWLFPRDEVDEYIKKWAEGYRIGGKGRRRRSIS